MGHDELSRIANISLIQAKEAAREALLSTKNKIMLSSENVEKNTLEVLNERSEMSTCSGNLNERSDNMLSPILELIGDRMIEEVSHTLIS